VASFFEAKPLAEFMWWFRAVLLFGFIVIASVDGARPATPAGGCSICGEGKCVSKPDAIFSFGSQPAVSCGTLEGLGYAGRQEIMQFCSTFFTIIGCVNATL
jgi:hypothetical protein